VFEVSLPHGTILLALSRFALNERWIYWRYRFALNERGYFGVIVFRVKLSLCFIAQSAWLPLAVKTGLLP